MKPFAIGLALALGLAAPALAQRMIAYPQNDLVTHAEARARAASFLCEKELKGGHSGGACSVYHDAVIHALGLENQRQSWCSTQMSEASNLQVSPTCFPAQTDLMRLSVISPVERKVSKKTWTDFDRAMSRGGGGGGNG